MSIKTQAEIDAVTTLNVLTAQIKREILGQQWFLVRVQRPMAAPAFNHPDAPADWYLYKFQDDQLEGSFCRRGHVLTEQEIVNLFAMVPADDGDQVNESGFWKQFACRYNLHETHTNTDPIILCMPAVAITDDPVDQIEQFHELYCRKP